MGSPERSRSVGLSWPRKSEKRGGAMPAMMSRGLLGLLALCLTWSVVVRYAEHGQYVDKDLQLSLQTPADCLRTLASFREELLRSFSQQSFAGIFTLTGTVVSVWRDPEVPGIRGWLPWYYRAVRVKSACQETPP
jgi:hypothetical protein